MDYLWQLVILIVTNTFTGGIARLIFIKTEKKKSEADAKKLESIANQELEKVKSQEISNTENVIKLYKEALEDIKDLNQREKLIMSKTIEEQDKKIEDLMKSQSTSKKIIEELTNKVNSLSSSLLDLQNFIKSQCSNCEFKNSCQRYKLKLKNVIDEEG